jgi:hypothetical protein
MPRTSKANDWSSANSGEKCEGSIEQPTPLSHLNHNSAPDRGLAGRSSGLLATVSGGTRQISYGQNLLSLER